MMEAASQFSGFQVINVGTEDHHSILDLIEVIFSHLGWRPLEILKELDKPIGVLSRASNNDICRLRLGWEPKWKLEEGIERTLRWYLESHGKLELENLENLLMERSQ
jgi:dTDP-glucose 4,6-dehydratase